MKSAKTKTTVKKPAKTTVKKPAKTKTTVKKPVTVKKEEKVTLDEKVTVKKEIKKKDNPLGLVRYKKVTKGVHYHKKGQVIKQGDVLECHPDELSDIIKLHFICLDEIKPEEDPGENLKVQKLDNGKFNVVNAVTGEPINEEELSKEEAEQISGEKVE